MCRLSCCDNWYLGSSCGQASEVSNVAFREISLSGKYHFRQISLWGKYHLRQISLSGKYHFEAIITHMSRVNDHSNVCSTLRQIPLWNKCQFDANITLRQIWFWGKHHFEANITLRQTSLSGKYQYQANITLMRISQCFVSMITLMFISL